MTTDRLIAIALFMAALIVSIAIHEAAHAYVALWLGDGSQRVNKRATLNPIRHLSPLGTLLPLVCQVINLPFLFGWGKPVPVNRASLSAGRWGYVLVALAGPASNILLCLAVGVVMGLIGVSSPHQSRDLSLFLTHLLQLNALLAVFNLLPLAPLDGSVLLQEILPESLRNAYEDYIAPYGFFIVLALIFSGKLYWIFLPAQWLIAVAEQISKLF
jgi:Zn-dependent protease